LKIKRHSKIIDLINNNEIETQEELADMLRQSGFEATQATVSRDIRDLKLLKAPGGKGRQKYVVSGSVADQVSDRLIRVFRDGVVSVDSANNIVIIKTLEGLAMGVAASLDSMGLSEIMGSIAGDDVIMCVTKTDEAASELIYRLNGILAKKTYD